MFYILLCGIEAGRGWVYTLAASPVEDGRGRARAYTYWQPVRERWRGCDVSRELAVVQDTDVGNNVIKRVETVSSLKHGARRYTFLF